MRKRFIILGLLVFVASLAVGSWLTSYNREVREAQLKPVWSLSLPERYIYGGNYTDGLVIIKGILYCLTTSEAYPIKQAMLYAIDGTNGAILWKKHIETKELLSHQQPLFIAADGLVCYKSARSSLCALNAETGTEQWEFKNVQSVLSISNGQIHIFDGGWQYIILDAVTGKIQSSTGIQGNVWSQALLSNGLRYFFNNKQLLATDLQTGKLIWAYDCNDTNFKMNSVAGILYVVANDILTAFDGKTGHKLWEQQHGLPPVIDGGTAYLGDVSGGTERIVKLNAITGEHLDEIIADYWSSARDVVVANGIIYSPVNRSHYSNYIIAKKLYGDDAASSYDYGVKAINASNSKILWTTQFIWGEYRTKPIIADSFIYFGVAAVDLGDSAQLFAYRVN